MLRGAAEGEEEEDEDDEKEIASRSSVMPTMLKRLTGLLEWKIILRSSMS